jgi:hypothetical protein
MSAAADQQEQTISVNLHCGRTSYTLAQIPVPPRLNGCALGEVIAAYIDKALEESCPTPVQ